MDSLTTEELTCAAVAVLDAGLRARRRAARYRQGGVTIAIAQAEEEAREMLTLAARLSEVAAERAEVAYGTP